MDRKALREILFRFWDDRDAGGRGQAAVEFAIAFPLQLFITFGLFQLALIGIATLLVNYAAYTAARAAIVGEDPARAAVLVLAPLGGTTRPEQGAGQAVDGEEPFLDGLRIPGWGTLWGSARAARKLHVRVNDQNQPYAPGLSRFTLKNPYAFDDAERFTEEAIRARERIDGALGSRVDARVVVEFDFELIFPLVDGIFELFLRPAGASVNKRVFGTEDIVDSSGVDPRNTAGGSNYNWIYDPDRGGYQRVKGRVRTLNGARHLVIARECSLHRGFALE